MIVGTVEGHPEIDQVMKQLGKCGVKKVVIAPFMIVAGDHAKNDMAGEEEDSWKNIISKAGYEVQTVLKGLGEYETYLQNSLWNMRGKQPVSLKLGH